MDGFRGRGLVNTFFDGDKSEGTLTSPEIEISHNHLSFLIGGGNHAGKTCLNLLVDGRAVRTATGNNAERLSWKSWDVRDLRGRKATLEIVDRHAGGWGHVNVDHVVLADAPARPASEPALWLDYGPDFYAAVSWSDIPQRDGRRLVIGWMSNWQYANDVPTAPWRSAMSLPRELALHRAADGLRIVQQPARELRKLREGHYRLRAASVREANDWLQRKGITGDQLEIELEFETAGAGECGLRILQDKDEATVIRCDPGHHRLVLDRTRAGKSDFHPAFARAFEAPLRVRDGRVRLHVIVDASSVEVFSDDGEFAITALVLPSENSRGLELFAESATARVKQMDIWKLKSGVVAKR